MRDVHSRDVKEELRSEVMWSGAPNLETHAERKAVAQEVVEESTKGTASGQRVERCEQVSVGFRRGKRADDVDVDVCKTAFGLRERSDTQFSMSMDLVLLTWNAGMA